MASQAFEQEIEEEERREAALALGQGPLEGYKPPGTPLTSLAAALKIQSQVWRPLSMRPLSGQLTPPGTRHRYEEN